MRTVIGAEAQAAPDRAQLIAEALGVPAGDGLAPYVMDLLSSLGLPARLRDAGVPKSELSVVAADVAADFSSSAGAGRSLATIRELLEESW